MHQETFEMYLDFLRVINIGSTFFLPNVFNIRPEDNVQNYCPLTLIVQEETNLQKSYSILTEVH